MAQAPTQPGFPLNHQPIFIGPQQVPQNVGRLRGSGPRQATGSLIITCGIVQIILGIVLLVLPNRNDMDCVSWGIWNGVVSEFCQHYVLYVLDSIFFKTHNSPTYHPALNHPLFCIRFFREFRNLVTSLASISVNNVRPTIGRLAK